MLTVLGLGLISPAGATARDHVFFPRAEGPPPLPSPFVGPDDRRIDARFCPFLPLRDSTAGRLLALSRSAAAEALASLPEGAAAGIPIYLVTPAPRPSLPEEALAGIARAMGDRLRGTSVQLLHGAAGVFAALAQIEELTARGQISAALVIGVESHATADALADRRRTPESPFLLAPPPPSEGAGAILVASPAQAARFGLPILGEILTSRTRAGRASDDNDAPNDAAAMTALVQGLPAERPIHGVFGQGRVDMLRLREWEWTMARAADRFAPSVFAPCIEAEIGALGAAAGAVNLALAFATFQHGAAPADAATRFVAWALSRDGTRGIALGSAPPTVASAALTPLVDAARARRVERDLFVPPAPTADEDPGDDEAWFEAQRAAANDVAPELPALPREIAPSPPVRLDPARVRDRTLADFYAGVVDHAGELAAALARDRLEAPRRRLPETEARLLRQIDAMVAAGPRALIEVAAFWERWIDDPFRAFAGALGAAAFEGDDALAVVHRAVHLTPPEAEDHAITIAEALSLSSHPGLAALGATLSGSAHPLARAVGVSLRAARGELPESALEAALGDSVDVVIRAAIWAADRLPAERRQGFSPRLRALCGAESPAVAWSAARVLALGGDQEVFREATLGALGERLGPRVAELFVLAGAPDDWGQLEARIGRHRVTRATVSAVARFGSAAAGPWLLQRLEDEALCDAAAEGLETLFGALVSPAQRREAGAWRGAIAQRGFDPQVRWRRGRAWSPSVVAEECASGELSRGAVERCIDELRARVGLREGVDVSGWWRRAQASLAAFLAAAAGRS